MNKMCISLPAELAEDGYRNREDPAKSAMTKAWRMNPWEMLKKDNNAGVLFDAAMEQQDNLPQEMIPESAVDWIDMPGDLPAGDVAFVDVGRENGHVLLKIAESTGGSI